MPSFTERLQESQQRNQRGGCRLGKLLERLQEEDPDEAQAILTVLNDQARYPSPAAIARQLTADEYGDFTRWIVSNHRLGGCKC